MIVNKPPGFFLRQLKSNIKATLLFWLPFSRAEPKDTKVFFTNVPKSVSASRDHSVSSQL